MNSPQIRPGHHCGYSHPETPSCIFFLPFMQNGPRSRYPNMCTSSASDDSTLLITIIFNICEASFALSDSVSAARVHASVGIMLSTRAEHALSGWVSVSDSSSRVKRHCLFVVSIYSPSDCSSLEEAEDYRDLSLLLSVRSIEFLVVASDFNAHIRCLAKLVVGRSHWQRLSFYSGLSRSQTVWRTMKS